MDASRVFKKVAIFPNYTDGHVIQWELDPFFRGKRPYNFSLEISQTIDFSELIFTKKNLGEVFMTVDDTGLKKAWATNYIYRVVLRTDDKKIYKSYPATFGNSPAEQRKYAMAAEMIRKEFVMCRYAGKQAWLLKRKSYGETTSVSKNVDPVSGVPIADTKQEDYGTGIAGGYFDPVPCAFFLENTSQDKQLDPQGMGVKETYDSMARLPGYPAIDCRDIICEAKQGGRYSIMAHGAKCFPGTDIVVTQKATLRLIPISDTIYSIPLPDAI